MVNLFLFILISFLFSVPMFFAWNHVFVVLAMVQPVGFTVMYVLGILATIVGFIILSMVKWILGVFGIHGRT